MPTKPTLVLTFELHAEPQRVFDALTQARHLERYLTTNVTMDLQVGGRFSNGDGESGKFLKVAVPRALVFTYTHSKLGLETEVDIKLTPSFPLGRTRLQMVQKGLDPKQITPETLFWMELRWKYVAAAVDAYLSGDKLPGFDAWRSGLSPVYADRA